MFGLAVFLGEYQREASGNQCFGVGDRHGAMISGKGGANLWPSSTKYKQKKIELNFLVIYGSKLEKSELKAGTKGESTQKS